jgi:hypothetical protein
VVAPRAPDYAPRMENAVPCEARKNLENQADHARAAAAPRPADAAPVTYTLKVLSGEDDGRRTVLFQRRSDRESIEISAETDSPNLLAHLPDLLDAALEIQRSLWPAQRVLARLPSSFFPLLAEESRLLRFLTDTGSTGSREVARRRVAREAMIVRDVAWEALRSVLGPARRGEIDALVGISETPAELAASMDAIAALLDRLLADPEGADRCAFVDIDAAYAVALREHASFLRASERAADVGAAPAKKAPRGLLRIIGAAFRVLRTEAFLLVPSLHSVTGADRRPPARRS